MNIRIFHVHPKQIRILIALILKTFHRSFNFLMFNSGTPFCIVINPKFRNYLKVKQLFSLFFIQELLSALPYTYPYNEALPASDKRIPNIRGQEMARKCVLTSSGYHLRHEL
ncbi:hypothetical protein JTE90_021194 [Oedothorax gibbosus]|uniref:Uncharacterized protein n=1 Tax=Oedothorax gibbosus TaxID=931172 RepID=A0AAV6V488_9ARAC|nr:hypothetical protein JTE90_021194 [Oedothorax gibbosus]